MSHMEFDVGKNSRAPDGLGSADNPRAPESDSQVGPGLCPRFLGDLPPARTYAIRSGNQSRREAPYLNQGDHLASKRAFHPGGFLDSHPTSIPSSSASH